MNRVYLVQHAYEGPAGEEEVKIIGVFSSEETAAAAIERLRTMPGFRDHPDGFHVGPYELDRDYWADGFVTMP
ncbi:MAG: hypothetical protein QM820_10320 [Minicystis sp.]